MPGRPAFRGAADPIKSAKTNAKCQYVGLAPVKRPNSYDKLRPCDSAKARAALFTPGCNVSFVVIRRLNFLVPGGLVARFVASIGTDC